MLKQKLDEENAESQAEQRRWLDLIRICRVETTHQLRAVLCGIHIEPPREEESIDILQWMYEHKDGRPPSMVIVIDLFGIMLSNQSDNEHSETLRYLTIDFNELSHILLNLVETNTFLSKRGHKIWQNATMEPVVMETQLIITDRGRIPHEENVEETNQVNFIKKLYHMLTYFIENII
ncbi:hypothetical protein RMATCC62417_16051 [Rhizopus microsporus]|nr:hypothetical protein RMATCC62417_16051 [Rhizopus microsporus]